jgi:CheY-like chemotaxis protein
VFWTTVACNQTVACLAELRSGTAKRFLVVEGDPVIGRMLTLLLQHDGHRAVAVTPAAEALDHLRASYVDVVLSEIGIDSSMDGPQLSACVRREWPRIQFVLGTRWMGLDAALARDHGAVMILTKPYHVAAGRTQTMPRGPGRWAASMLADRHSDA